MLTPLLGFLASAWPLLMTGPLVPRRDGRENELGRLWGSGQEGPLLKVLKRLNARAVFIGFHVRFALGKVLFLQARGALTAVC